MADITNEEVVRFLNEGIRPISELLERLDIESGALVDRYFAQIAPLVAANADADLIEDGRAAEGVSRVTKGDLVNSLTLLQQIQTAFGGAGKRDVIRKPTVQIPKLRG